MVSTRWGTNLLSWFTVPRNRRTSPTFPGAGMPRMADTLLGSGLMLLLSTTWPKKLHGGLGKVALLGVQCHAQFLEMLEGLLADEMPNGK